jgi:hypothetical protein
MYKNVIMLIVMLNACISTAQNIEKVLFESICQKIIQNDEYSYLKEKISQEVILVCNPENYEEKIYYVNKRRSNDKYLKAFKKYSYLEQFDIMKSLKVPILLSTDTLFILDSVNLFSRDMGFKFKGYFFQTVKHVDTTRQYICISSIFIRNEDSFENGYFYERGYMKFYLFGGNLKDILISCRIKIGDRFLKIHKMSFAKIPTSIGRYE